MRRIREAYPKSRGFDVVVTPWKDELTAKARPTLMILLVTTVFVLVIACANVANLTLTRLVQREREMGIRAALGAPAAFLRRQLLAENLVLSVFGGLLGLAFAVSGLNLLIAYTARFTSRVGEIGLDGRVLAFTLVVSTAMALLFAWAPRLTFMNDPVRAMAAGGGRHRRPRAAARAARAGRQPAGRVVHAADRRRTPDAQPDAAVRRQSGLRSRARAQSAGAQLRSAEPRTAGAVRDECSNASRRKRR